MMTILTAKPLRQVYILKSVSESMLNAQRFRWTSLLLVLCWAVTSRAAMAQPQPAGPPIALTQGDAFYTGPKWSPDGSRLAFSTAGYTGLHVLDLETGEIRTISEAPGVGFGFEWSPDGDRIVAREARFDGPRRLDAVTVFDPSSGAAQRLTEFRSHMPALPRWDASGGNVVLLANETPEVLPYRDIEIGKRSPQAVVAGTRGLARVDADTGTAQPIPVDRDQPILNPTVSPDGDRIAFEMMGGNLFVVNTDGSGLVDLGLGNRPSWSPDGQWIVFMRTKDDGHAFTESDLYAIRGDGTGLVRLTATPDRLEMNPDWSPDGSAIAFDDITDGIIYRLPITY